MNGLNFGETLLQSDSQTLRRFYLYALVYLLGELTLEQNHLSFLNLCFFFFFFFQTPPTPRTRTELDEIPRRRFLPSLAKRNNKRKGKRKKLQRGRETAAAVSASRVSLVVPGLEANGSCLHPATFLLVDLIKSQRQCLQGLHSRLKLTASIRA